ncbi:hypothetical protein [Clostridium saccharobutylicum]|nr:hypothetical protein [Clostridium saccharobutylicum]
MNLHEIDLRKLYRIWKADLGPFQGFLEAHHLFHCKHMMILS